MTYRVYHIRTSRGDESWVIAPEESYPFPVVAHSSRNLDELNLKVYDMVNAFNKPVIEHYIEEREIESPLAWEGPA